jgi:glutamyl-tRNA reductase
MIGLLGINHKTCSLEIREKYSFTNQEIIEFSELLYQETNISDIVILSTCNRTEIYFSQDLYDRQMAFEQVYNTLNLFKSIVEHHWHAFYHKSNVEAVTHLFEVASGLDSMILGEDQIIGQIKEAYLFCTKAALTDDILMRLFQKSFEAGKRVRSETGIKLGNTSISSAAVELCNKHMGGLAQKSLLIVGAGDTSTLALQNFKNKAVKNITITNRTLSNAQTLANNYKAKVLEFDNFQSQLHLFDIVCVATHSKDYLIKAEDVTKSAQHSANKQQIFIDLSVPRNIDESISQFENIQLICVDDLEAVVQITAEKRQECIEQATIIIQKVQTEFSEWLASRSLRPAIKTITSVLQSVHNKELKLNKKYDSIETQIAVEEYAEHLTQRYTGLLIKNLKELTNNGKNIDSLKIVDELFKLDEANHESKN